MDKFCIIKLIIYFLKLFGKIIQILYLYQWLNFYIILGMFIWMISGVA